MAKNPLKIIGWVWHICNVPFDKTFGDIKDLSFFIKLTILSLFFTGFVFLETSVNSASGTVSLITGVAIVLLVVLAIIWMGYLPFLIGRIIIYYLKKNRIIN